MFRHKSKLLLAGIAANVVVITELFVRIILAIIWVSGIAGNAFSKEVFEASIIFLWVPQLATGIFSGLVYFVSIIVFVLATFNLVAAWFMYKTDKKSWTITCVVLFIIIGFVGEILRGSSTFTLLYVWYAGIPLQVMGYFMQKRINSLISKTAK